MVLRSAWWTDEVYCRLGEDVLGVDCMAARGGSSSAYSYSDEYSDDAAPYSSSEDEVPQLEASSATEGAAAPAPTQQPKKEGFAKRMRRLSVEAIGAFASKLAQPAEQPTPSMDEAQAEQAAAEKQLAKHRMQAEDEQRSAAAQQAQLAAQRRQAVESLKQRQEAEAAAALAAAESPEAKVLVAELHAAAMAGDSAWIERLATQLQSVGVKHLDGADGAGWTALHQAVNGAQYEATTTLLRCGADPNAATKQGSTPLFWATSVQFVRLLLVYKCARTPCTRLAFHYTAFPAHSPMLAYSCPVITHIAR